MVNNRFNLKNKGFFHRLRKLYKKPVRKDVEEESITAMTTLNQNLIPDFHSVSMELNFAKKLSPHIHTFTPLHFAVFADVTINELKLLLIEEDVNSVAYNNMTPLHMALCLKLNPLEMVMCLIDHGADVNCRMKSFQFTPLLIAIYADLYDVLKLLIVNGADVDASNNDGLNPLILASALGNEDMVKTLIQYGAQVNCQLQNSQLTPLHLASMKINPAFLNDIIRPNRELSSDEDMIIMEMEKSRIVEQGREQIVSYLLNNGANIQVKDISGKTPLHYAVQYENLCVEILLKFGADVNVCDNNNRLPLHHAINNQQGCNLECLIKYGADIYDVDKIDRLAFHKTVEGSNGSPILLLFDAHINGVYEECKINPERATIFQELLEQRILEYLVKMEAANLHINDNSKNLIDEIGFDHFYIECLNEVDKMKLFKIKRNFSIYDLLHMKPKHRSRLLKNCHLPINFEKRFPIYWDLLQASFCKGKKKKKLLSGRKFSWYWITNGEVPDIYVKNAPERSNRTLNVMSSYWYKGV